ncbi:hypothetical protein AVEN_191115-1 [Araneus ventricosus]|uniref:Uncharacterized protein n=1 Tax=Araneus ventricosus TaxID=182803 RepID=A0A4Y2AYL1_ARAVE|nr:hypothetical protein AVEN_191115-1 [Araneus ventricosus]
MWLRSCSATRKPLVSATNRKKIESSFSRNIEIGPLSNGNKSCGQMNPDLFSSNMMVASELEEKHMDHCSRRVPYSLYKPLGEEL